MGTSIAAASIAGDVEDHPHAYGDKNKMFNLDIWYQGSSPRIWGQEFPDTTADFPVRIIPTRMGTSTQQPLLSRKF